MVLLNDTWIVLGETMTSFLRLFLILICAFTTNLQADVITNNTWTLNTGTPTGASGTITDSSLPGFSADFTIIRSNVVSFGGPVWTGGNQLNLLNGSAGTNPGAGDSVQLELSFSNIVGGTIAGVVSEYGTTTNNDVDATWTYTWTTGGSATLLDPVAALYPSGQMAEADNSTFTTGGLVTNATSELNATEHTWCVTIPTNSVILNWASPTHAFAEAMAFRVQVAAPAPVPTLSSWGIMLAILILGILGIRFTRQNVL